MRPDTYVGSTEFQDQQMWVCPGDHTTQVFEQRIIKYVPALYKIFDEILVNAADNFSVREYSLMRVELNLPPPSLSQRDKRMKRLEVVIDPSKNLISILNDGKGIPVQIHKEYNIFVPELIFGHLLTSSNYNDAEKKVTGGRNGYGAKLTNIFSTKFIVETADSKQKKSEINWKISALFLIKDSSLHQEISNDLAEEYVRAIRTDDHSLHRCRLHLDFLLS